MAAEGRVLLSADYSQIELRILAHLSKDPELLKAFQEGADIHVRTASQVFGVPEKEVTPEQRARTKAINFGIIYGQSGFGLARTLGIAQAEARAQIDAYFARYPGVRAFIREAIQQRREARLRAHHGGPPPLPAGPALPEPSDAPGRGTHGRELGYSGDGGRCDQTRHDRARRGPGSRGGPSARMILQVHDELVFEVAPADLEALQKLRDRAHAARRATVRALGGPRGERSDLARSALEKAAKTRGPGRIRQTARWSKP